MVVLSQVGYTPLAMETEKQMTAKAMVQKVQKMLRKRNEWMSGSWLRISSTIPNTMMASWRVKASPSGLYVTYKDCAGHTHHQLSNHSHFCKA